MSLTLQDLGLSQDELVDRVVNATATALLTSTVLRVADDDEDEDTTYQVASPLKKQLDAEIQRRVDTAVAALLAQHIEPLVASKLETLLLVPTNQWGERKGEPETFLEYATRRADAYLTEKVNHDGKSQSEANGYSWSASTTRVVHLANQYLKFEIERAMKAALADVNSRIAGGISAAVTQAMTDVQQRLKIEVKS